MYAPRILLLALLVATPVCADDLTKMIQDDLAALGYDPGEATGEKTIPTVVAISQFQSEHGLEVTGEPTPQLAGIIKAQMNKPKTGETGAAAEPAEAAAPALSPEALRAAQQQCLQEKYEAAQEAQKKKRGLTSLVSAVARTANLTGNTEVATDISQVSYDVYNANATASDLASAAKDLGLTEDEVEACRNPL